MSLNIDKSYKYARPYDTNWTYLHNMTSLQVKALKEMEWIETSEYIDTGLWGVPWITFSKSDATKYFIDDLNNKIKGL